MRHIAYSLKKKCVSAVLVVSCAIIIAGYANVVMRAFLYLFTQSDKNVNLWTSLREFLSFVYKNYSVGPYGSLSSIACSIGLFWYMWRQEKPVFYSTFSLRAINQFFLDYAFVLFLVALPLAPLFLCTAYPSDFFAALVRLFV